MKRVLIIGCTSLYGGIGNLMLGLSDKMHGKELHFDFLFVDPVKDNEEKLIHKMGGKFFHIPHPKNGAFRFLVELFRFYKNNKYDIVHCNSGKVIMFLLVLPLWFRRKPKIIHHSHGAGLQVKIYQRIFRFFILRRANLLIAVSKNAALSTFGSNVANNGKYIFIKNGIDVNKFTYNEEIRSRMRKQLNIEEKYVIGHIGRFLPVKNHSFIIDVFALIAKKDPNAVLLLIGTGADEDNIRKKVHNYGLGDSVIFYGTTPNAHELLQAMDVFFFPSFSEGLPIVSIEAQSADLPVVASTGIPKEAKITTNFHFMDLHSDPKEAWAKKICSFKNHVRKDTSAEIKHAGFDIEESAKTLKSIYLDTL
jgi:glycosyltransferase involved in cell wall biosynthesis